MEVSVEGLAGFAGREAAEADHRDPVAGFEVGLDRAEPRPTGERRADRAEGDDETGGQGEADPTNHGHDGKRVARGWEGRPSPAPVIGGR